MVKKITNPTFECGICHIIYKTEVEANDCEKADREEGKMFQAMEDELETEEKMAEKEVKNEEEQLKEMLKMPEEKEEE